jgi:Domain of unknown function (DUF1937)
MSGILTLDELRVATTNWVQRDYKAVPGVACPSFVRRKFLWYVATPYTHKDADVRAHRATLATNMAGALIEGGLNVFSPIAAHHPASMTMQRPDNVSHADWMDICYGVMDRCDGLIVSTMDGWWESKGVQLEIKRWKQLKTMKRALYASPITMTDAWTPTFAWKPDQVGAK